VDDKDLVRVLRALADKGRFRMVQEIAAAGELSCGQVVERFNLTQPTISHHLKILSDAGVLIIRRDGQHGLISVNQARLNEAAALLPRRLRVTPGQPSSRKPERARRAG